MTVAASALAAAATGTLESRFSDKIQHFARRRAELEEELRRVEAASSTSGGGGDAGAGDGGSNADDRRAELRRLLTDAERQETEYVLDSVPFIREYSSSTQAVPQAESSSRVAPTRKGGSMDDFVSVTHKSNRNNVLRRYMLHVEKRVDRSTMAALAEHEAANTKHNAREAEYFCDACDSSMCFNSRESMLVCVRCGTCKSFTEMNANNLTYDQEINLDVVTYFAYKRLNHFCEWLNSLQAKVGCVCRVCSQVFSVGVCTTRDNQTQPWFRWQKLVR